MTGPILFHRALLRKRRERAAAGYAAHDFLRREAGERLADSLAVIKQPLPRLASFGADVARTGSEVIHCDLSPGMLRGMSDMRVVCDEEFLPFAEHSLDGIVSALMLHNVNDLPGTLVQIRHALKADGLFLSLFFGAETLRELRQVFADTEASLSGGVTPRIAPFAEVREAGNLLARAGFALPVAASEILTVTYPNLDALLRDLRGMGEANILHGRLPRFTARRFFREAAVRYAAQYGDGEGGIVASFEFLTLTAWKPAANQQQPARRGSGQISLTQVLN